MTRIIQLTIALSAVFSTAMSGTMFAAGLADSFKSPPDAARPGVYWFWMGGMVSREGISKDLEALAAQGVGRVLVMQMPEQCPFPWQWAFRDYPGKVKVLSDEWFDLVNHAVGECDRLGLEMAFFACPGWGHVGGPWVPAEKGIKVMAVTTTPVQGPGAIERPLSKPPVSPAEGGGNQIPTWNHAHKLLPKPGEGFFRDMAVLAVPDPGGNKPVPPEQILDLTVDLDDQGILRWEAPAGNWTIHRICLILQNGLNHPAPPEAMGWEVDRMDPEAVRLVFDNMVGRILREARAKGYSSFTAYETDSYETAYQDFGLDFIQAFRKRRGYDCRPWLPVWRAKSLVIGSRDLTDRFRHDMQRTISELWAERFQGTLRKLADEHGITWMTEPYFWVPLDWTTVGGRSTMPGAEFWVGDGNGVGRFLGNAPEIAAVYGRDIVWAEAFTAESYHSAWRNDPWVLKRSGNVAFASGINLFYMHGFTHNPFPDRYQPGLTMGYWGTQLSRHLTWWPFSRPWHEYLARCQHMLRQGRPVYHALKYPASYANTPTMSDGSYRTAQLTDEILLGELSVENGLLALPHGARFHALLLTGGALRPEALEKIKALKDGGATIIGSRPPRQSPSLENHPACDARAAALIDEIWGGAPGSGRVLGGSSLEQAMETIGQLPDFTFTPAPGQSGPSLNWHRRDLGDVQVWFVANYGYGKVAGAASFNIGGRQPEWWDPVDGSIRKLPEFRFEHGRTLVPISLEPLQSGFVVFREKATGDVTGGLNFPALQPVMTLDGPWEVSFDPRWGGPEEPVHFGELTDWAAHPEKGIRFYSGTAIYRKRFDLPPSTETPGTLFLDLGQVHNLAQVKLNGKDLGTVWCAPWRVGIPAKLIRSTGNELELTVVNTWVNRLIGDELEPADFQTVPGDSRGKRLGSYHPGVRSRGLKDLPDWLLKNESRPSSGRFTFTSWQHYDSKAPLQPSGLLGPVRMSSEIK